MTIKELKLETRQLRRIEKSIQGGSPRGFTETETLLTLLPYIQKQIEWRVFRTEEQLLSGRIKSSKTVVDTLFLGSFPPAHAWIEGLEKTCQSRVDSQQRTWLVIIEMLPWVEPLIRRLNLPPNHVLLQTLPKPVAYEVNSCIPIVTKTNEVACESIEETGATKPQPVAEKANLSVSMGVKVTEGAPENIEEVRTEKPKTAADEANSVRMGTEATKAPSDSSGEMGTKQLQLVADQENSSVQMGMEATEDASGSVQDAGNKKPHKGKQLGEWAKAIDDCISSLGREVGYASAAEWLGYNDYQVLPDFLDHYGGMPEKKDRMCLVKLVGHNGKARKRLQNQLFEARRRFDGIKPCRAKRPRAASASPKMAIVIPALVTSEDYSD